MMKYIKNGILYSVWLLYFAHSFVSASEELNLNINESSNKSKALSSQIKAQYTYDYLSNRSVKNNENIVLTPTNERAGGIKKYKNFIKIYKLEKRIFDWVVVFQRSDDITKIEELVKNNVEIYKKHATLESSELPVESTSSAFGADNRAVNYTMNKYCRTSIISTGAISKLTFITRKKLKTFEFCNAYPVILGVNNLMLVYQNENLVVRKAD